MLGYDVEFAYIHAVKLAQQGNAFEKRSGNEAFAFPDKLSWCYCVDMCNVMYERRNPYVSTVLFQVIYFVRCC